MTDIERRMIGQRIKQLRQQKYWTQRELGVQAGIEPKNIGGYESGRLRAGRKVLEKFAQALGVTFQDLTQPQAASEFGRAQDPELAQLVGELSLLPEADRNHIKWVLNTALRYYRIQSAIAS